MYVHDILGCKLDFSRDLLKYILLHFLFPTLKCFYSVFISDHFQIRIDEDLHLTTYDRMGRLNIVLWHNSFKNVQKIMIHKKVSFFENNMNLYEKYLLWGPFGSTKGRTPPTIPQITVKSKTGTQEAPIFDWNSL